MVQSRLKNKYLDNLDELVKSIRNELGERGYDENTINVPCD